MSAVRLEKLNLELTSRCDLQCVHCSRRFRRQQGEMPLARVAAILDQFSDAADLRVSTLYLFLAGELLLYSDLAKALALVARHKRDNVLFPNVIVSTNAMRLDERNAELLLESGAVDLVQFSVDGTTPEEFEALRPGARWPTVLTNMTRFLDLRQARNQPVLTRINIVTTRPAEDHFARSHADLRALLARVDAIKFDRPLPLHVEPADERNGAGDRPAGLCPLAPGALAINADSTVVPCCGYLENEYALGTLDTQPLREILTGPARETLMANLRAGARRKNPICRRCAVPDAATDLAGLGFRRIYRPHPAVEQRQRRRRLAVLAATLKRSGAAPVVIYGAGATGRQLADELLEQGGSVRCFVDRAADRLGAAYRAIPMVTPAALAQLRSAPVLIASRGYHRQLEAAVTANHPALPCYNLAAYEWELQ